MNKPILRRNLPLSDVRGRARQLNYAGQGHSDMMPSLLNFNGDSKGGLSVNQFTYQIANGIGTGVTLTARLFAGYLRGNSTLAPGQVTDGAFNDTGGTAGLTGTATTPNKKIDELTAYLNEVPTRILAVKISTTTTAQVNQNFVYRPISPYNDRETEIIYPANFTNQNTFQNKEVIFGVNKQADYEMDLQYSILDGDTVSFTWYFGAEANVAKYLEKEARLPGSGLRDQEAALLTSLGLGFKS